MSGFVVFLVVLAFVGVLVWQYMATKNALATTRVESHYPPHEVIVRVQGQFAGARSALWTDAPGPGSINKRRRGKDGGITMSIAIEPLGNGGSSIEMWASTYNEYLLVLANFAGSVNSRKKAIAGVLAG